MNPPRLNVVPRRRCQLLHQLKWQQIQAIAILEGTRRSVTSQRDRSPPRLSCPWLTLFWTQVRFPRGVTQMTTCSCGSSTAISGARAEPWHT